MGLIQRVIETAGISTISVSLSKGITQKLRPPRAVFPGFPLGHPIGFPNRSTQQLKMSDGVILEPNSTYKTEKITRVHGIRESMSVHLSLDEVMEDVD